MGLEFVPKKGFSSLARCQISQASTPIRRCAPERRKRQGGGIRNCHPGGTENRELAWPKRKPRNKPDGPDSGGTEG